MKQLRVKILDKDYVLSVNDAARADLIEAAESVDQHMQTIKKTEKPCSEDRIAVYVALQFAFELRKNSHGFQPLPSEQASPNLPVETHPKKQEIRRLTQRVASSLSAFQRTYRQTLAETQASSQKETESGV